MQPQFGIVIEQYHVNINAVNNKGDTPLPIALLNGSIDIVQYLIVKQNANKQLINH